MKTLIERLTNQVKDLYKIAANTLPHYGKRALPAVVENGAVAVLPSEHRQYATHFVVLEGLIIASHIIKPQIVKVMSIEDLRKVYGDRMDKFL